MATRRERKETKIERVEDWAASRDRKALSAEKTAFQIGERFTDGQPILAGHHSAPRALKDRDRMHSAMTRTVEHSRMADSHRRRAANIGNQLDQSVYSDDPDAIERLRKRIEGLEAQRAEMKTRNAAFRHEHKDRLRELSAFQRDLALPHQSYELSNLGGRISKDRKRLAQLEAESPDTRMAA